MERRVNGESKCRCSMNVSIYVCLSHPFFSLSRFSPFYLSVYLSLSHFLSIFLSICLFHHSLLPSTNLPLPVSPTLIHLHLLMPLISMTSVPVVGRRESIKVRGTSRWSQEQVRAMREPPASRGQNRPHPTRVDNGLNERQRQVLLGPALA